MDKNRLQNQPLIPLVTFERASDGIPVAEALLAGGVNVIEVTLRSPAGLGAIEAIASRFPDMWLGAGSVLDPSGMSAAKDHGAQFCVSPGWEPSLAKKAASLHMPYLPGVATASEIMAAMAAGYDLLKLFPVFQLGGPPGVAALSAPFPQLQVCVAGGVQLQDLPSYLRTPQVVAVAGGFVVPKEALQNHDFALITRLAKDARSLCRSGG